MRQDDHATSSPLEKCASFLFQLAQKYGFLFLAFALGGTFLCGVYASDLRVSQDFRKLLPQDSPSIAGLLRVDRSIGNQSDLYIVIESPSREENIRFGEQVHREISQWTDVFRFVTFKRDVEFFEANALLFASIPELLEMHDRVQHRIKQEVTDSMALDSTKGENETSHDTTEDSMGIETQRPSLPEPYMETNDGQLMVVIARPNFPNTAIEESRVLYTRLKATLDALQAKGDNGGFKVSLQGSFAEQSRRQSELDASIVKGSFLAFFILFGSIGWYFRSSLAVLWILIPLTISIIMALAMAMYLYGFLNIVSAFIVAILLGIGIDFGIHLMTRYRDERRGGHPPAKAVKIAMTQTGASTLAGAISTAASLFLLVFAEFQGLAQFGVVAGIGVILAFVAAALLMPKLILRVGEGRGLAQGHRTSPFPSHTGKHPKIALIPLGLGLIALIGGLIGGQEVSFEYDLEKLGSIRSKPKSTSNKKSWRSALPSGATTATMVVITEGDEETEFVLEQLSFLREQRRFEENPPVPWAPANVENSADIVEPEDDEDPFDDDDPFEDDDPFGEEKKDPLVDIRATAYNAPSPTERTARILEEYGQDRVGVMRDRLERVRSIHSFVPSDQESKLKIIRETRKAIKRKRAALSEESLKELEEWEHYLDVDKPVNRDGIPDWVRVQFLDVEGREDRFLVIKTLGAKADIANATRIRDAFSYIETQNDPRPSAASFYVLPAVVEALHRDGPVLLILAFSILLLTAWFLFKTIASALVVAATVATSLIWLLGVMAVMGWKIDLFNLIAIPLIVGMGQDHALHMLHRIREDGLESIGRIIRETGGAIALTTWTTSIGFVGVMMAPHAGLQSLARVSLTGIILALFASVFFLPSILIAQRWYQARSSTS